MEVGGDKAMRETSIERQVAHSCQLGDQAQNILQRLAVVVDKLAGPEPEQPTEATKQPEVLSGALGELQGNLQRVGNLQRNLVDLISRLERHV